MRAAHAIAQNMDPLKPIVDELKQRSQVSVFTISAVSKTGLDAMLQEIWSILDTQTSQEEDKSLTAET